ncbi:Protein of uncharacterised function (DUF3313) [Escherichia coli]|nr:Protein of uncharacterised function (DUF3313) [Escherichia coli]VWM67451.1 Protein of uncharacterised function (DUF3313) [Escherichia coli]
MRTTSFAKVAALCGLLALSGCASKITQPDKYSGFLNNYSDLKETTSATGKPVLRWVDPSFDQSKYDSSSGTQSLIIRYRNRRPR